MFLYYALIGLSSQCTNIRVYSLNMLTTIVSCNADSMLEIVDRVNLLAEENFWEVKAQCLEFATAMLSQYRALSHLMAHKDELKAKGSSQVNDREDSAAQNNVNGVKGGQ